MNRAAFLPFSLHKRMQLRQLSLVLLFLFVVFPVSLDGMSLKTEKKTNKLPSYVMTYEVGMLAFSNNTGNTNYDFLSLSIPLMMREELKKTIDFFVNPEDLLKKGEGIDWERTWRSVSFLRRREPMPIIDLARQPLIITNTNQETLTNWTPSLRRRIHFQNDVILRNDMTYAEVAKQQDCHFLMYGTFDYVGRAGAGAGKERQTDPTRGPRQVRVRVFFYNAIQGRVIGRFSAVFSENRVLLELDKLVNQVRKAIVRYPIANVRIETKPDGAMVYVDGRYMGRSPLTLSALAATNHEFFLRKEGFVSRKLEISVESNREYLFSKELKPVPESGSLAVTSSPTGAVVLLDLIEYGTTPLVISNLKAGEYRVRVEKAGYNARYLQATIKDDEKSALDVSLDRYDPDALTVEEKTERYRKWMNIFFWSGGASLLTYSYLYFSYEEYRHEYEMSGSDDSRSSALTYRNASDVALGVTAGCLTVSAYFMLRYMLTDDKELGFAPTGQPDFYTGVSPDGRFSMNWRF